MNLSGACGGRRKGHCIANLIDLEVDQDAMQTYIKEGCYQTYTSSIIIEWIRDRIKKLKQSNDIRVRIYMKFIISMMKDKVGPNI